MKAFVNGVVIALMVVWAMVATVVAVIASPVVKICLRLIRGYWLGFFELLVLILLTVLLFPVVQWEKATRWLHAHLRSKQQLPKATGP